METTTNARTVADDIEIKEKLRFICGKRKRLHDDAGREKIDSKYNEVEHCATNGKPEWRSVSK